MRPGCFGSSLMKIAAALTGFGTRTASGKRCVVTFCLLEPDPRLALDVREDREQARRAGMSRPPSP